MADNDITAAPNTTPGAQAIASDDIGGVQFQRIKLIHGADGTNDGDVAAANPLPIEISDGTDTALVSAGGALSVSIDAETAPVTVDQATAANLNAQVVGDIAHDTADSGNPVKLGAKSISFGGAPTEVAAADRTDLYATNAGQLFVIGGHPNVVTIRANYTAAQTDTAIATTTEKLVVTRVSVMADNANTVDVQARIGFGATTTPTTTGVLLSHPGVAAGSGVTVGDGSGILGVGAAGEDIRITSEVPTTGSIDVVVSYYEISA